MDETAEVVMGDEQTVEFVDHFLSAPRPIPDISLMVLLELQKNTGDLFEKMAHSELLLTYVLGKAYPTLSPLEGIVWKVGEVC